MTIALGLTLVGLGFVGAFISGLVGVGGAVVMIPLLLYVPPLLGVGHLDMRDISGVTMAQVFVASALGAWTHARGSMVHHRLALTGGAAMAAAALAGAVASRYVSSRGLLAVFAVMATVALPLMLVPPVEPWPAGPRAARPGFNPIAAVACPGVIGLASGMVGAGGAFLLVPVLIAVLRIPVRMTIGTSLAMTCMSAAMGFAGKAVTRQVPWWLALAVIAGSLPGAPAGAKVSHRLSVHLLRLVLAALIAVVIVRVWVDVLGRS